MNEPGPIDLGTMRRINTASTLRALHADRTATLRRLTRRTGLSRRTVEIILEALIAEKWAMEAAPDATTRAVGRPPREFRFNPQRLLAMGVNVAQDFIDVSVCDLHGTVLGTWKSHTAPDEGTAARVVLVGDMVGAALRALDVPGDKVGAVTISELALPAGADASDPDLRSRFGEALAKDFRCDVVTENRAKLSAVGEGWRGAAQGVKDYITVLRHGRGIGLGIVIDGQVYRGSTGRAGEMLWLGDDTQAALAELAHLYDPETAPGRADLAILSAANRGDAAALAHIKTLAAALAPGLLTALWVLDTRLVVISGGWSRASGQLIPALEHEFGESAPEGVELRGSTLGTSAVLFGALRSSLDRIEAEHFATG